MDPLTSGGIDAIVLAGGTSRRMGHTDKLTLDVRGRPLARRVIDACCEATSGTVVVAIGPTDQPARRAALGLDERGDRVIWCADDDELAGPVAGVVAGARRCSGTIVLVVVGDMPDLDASLLTTLIDALGDGVHAAVPMDATGRRQVGVVAWRRTALTRALASMTADADARRSLTGILESSEGLVVDIDLGDRSVALADIDSPDDLDATLRPAGSPEQD